MDTWERRGIPYTRGWNNAPDMGVTFQVQYAGGDPDSIVDALVIVASQPIFGSTEFINFQGSAGSGSLTLSVADFTVVNPTTILVQPAGAKFFQPTTLTHLDFLTSGSVLQGTWTGSVPITTPVPVVTITYSGAPNSGNPSTFIISGTHFELVDRFHLIGASIDRYYYDPDGPNANLNYPGVHFDSWNHSSSLEFYDQDDDSIAFHSVSSVDALDIDGNIVASSSTIAFQVTPDPLRVPSLNYGYSPAADRFVIQGHRFDELTTAPPVAPLGSITLRFRIPNDDGRLEATYYPPVGQPGNLDGTLNDPAVTINSWTNHEIDITDTRFSSIGAMHPSDMPFVVTSATIADESGTAYNFIDHINNGAFPVDGSGVAPTEAITLGNSMATYPDSAFSNGSYGVPADGSTIAGTLLSTSPTPLDYITLYHVVGDESVPFASFAIPGSPNSSLNPPGATISPVFMDQSFHYDAPILAGEDIVGVTAYDVSGSVLAAGAPIPSPAAAS